MTGDTGRSVVPFGKYKGRDVLEVLDSDPNYLQWLTAQSWFREKYITLHQTIINRGGEPQETPDHNALQVLFLDDNFCLRFFRALYRHKNLEQELYDLHQRRVGDALEQVQSAKQKLQETKNELEATFKNKPGLFWEKLDTDSWLWKHNKDKHAKATAALKLEETDYNSLAVPITKTIFKFRREFERGGIDVTIWASMTSDSHPFSDRTLHPLIYRFPSCHVEIKPVVGDDYPVVLRQMKRLEANQTGNFVLFLKSYNGEGATREQFIRTFSNEGFHVRFLDECE